MSGAPEAGGWPTPWTIKNDRCVLCGHVLARTAAEAALMLYGPDDNQPESLELVSEDDSYGYTFRAHHPTHYVILFVKATSEYPKGRRPRPARATPQPMADLFTQAAS